MPACTVCSSVQLSRVQLCVAVLCALHAQHSLSRTTTKLTCKVQLDDLSVCVFVHVFDCVYVCLLVLLLVYVWDCVCVVYVCLCVRLLFLISVFYCNC